MSEIGGYLALCLAALAAGLINSVAGGGSLISFPALVAFGVPPLAANATNTASVWPGTLSSAWAYREYFPRERALVWPLVVTSLLGGIVGAAVLVSTPPEAFQALTPWLVLFATVLFAAKDFFSRLAGRISRARFGAASKAGRAAGFVFQFVVAVYGGYFGAGIGILMLAAFALMGVGEIHRMNALKVVLASILNGIALVFFALAGLVVWHLALGLGLCATLGGYIGAHTAKKLPVKVVHRVIVALGFAAAFWLFYRNLA